MISLNFQGINLILENHDLKFTFEKIDFKFKSNHRKMQAYLVENSRGNDYPINIPIKGKFSGWKYFKPGIILESYLNTKPDGEKVYSKCFHYIDNRGKSTFQQLRPDFQYTN